MPVLLMTADGSSTRTSATSSVELATISMTHQLLHGGMQKTGVNKMAAISRLFMMIEPMLSWLVR